MATTRRKPLADPVGDYARAVLAGEIVAGKLVIQACQRHIDDLEAAPASGFRFDRGAALRAIEFFPTFLVHYKGRWAGQPFELSDWQKFIVGSLFGWLNAATGRRRFKNAYVQIARKNGKSALAAGVALICFVFDNEAAPEIYTAATKRDQAKIVWQDAAEFVSRDAELSGLISRYRNTMLCAVNSGVFTPLAADAQTMDGLNPSCAIIDELHRHPSREVVDVLDTATGARDQPLIFMITTAGDDVFSCCFDEFDYSSQVLAGNLADPARFAYIASIDDDDDWKDPAVYVKANPNLGVSIELEYLKEKALEAQNLPAKRREFRRLRLDAWSETVGGWVDLDAWNKCATAVSDDDLAGAECFAGIDLSKTRDITAKVLIFPPAGDRDLWAVRSKFYVPEAKIEAARLHRADDRVPYDLWHKDEMITATPGNVVDYEFIKKDLGADRDLYDLTEIGFDPWNATQFAQDLDADGFVTVEVRQGYKTLSAPMKFLEGLYIDALLAHGGHPVLTWMAGNVSVDIDPNENVKPNKAKSRNRIDGIVALIIAIERAISRPNIGPSVYETRGVIAA